MAEEIKDTNTNKLTLPAIPIRGIVPLPHIDFRIEVGRENSIKALEEAEKMYSGNILLLVQKNNNTDITKENLESVLI